MPRLHIHFIGLAGQPAFSTVRCGGRQPSPRSLFGMQATIAPGLHPAPPPARLPCQLVAPSASTHLGRLQPNRRRGVDVTTVQGEWSCYVYSWRGRRGPASIVPAMIPPPLPARARAGGARRARAAATGSNRISHRPLSCAPNANLAVAADLLRSSGAASLRNMEDTKTAADYYVDSYSHFGIHEEMLKVLGRNPVPWRLVKTQLAQLCTALTTPRNAAPVLRRAYSACSKILYCCSRILYAPRRTRRQFATCVLAACL